MKSWPALLLALLLPLSPVMAAEKVSDDRLHDEIVIKLAGDQEVRGNALEVEVHDGVVTLKGKVDTDKRKQRAERLVKKVKGVSGVVNEIVISK